MQSTAGLTREQRGRYHDDGFVRLPGFASREVCERMLERVIEIARAHAAGEPGAPGLVLPEANLAGSTGDPEDSGSEPVLMSPGDLLLFDSHLMHRSTDNESAGIRAAMVYHFAA
ncbi:MAG: phytanoyl-CoA dioxygenase family protein, partial [Acidimicrobiales bacterium]